MTADGEELVDEVAASWDEAADVWEEDGEAAALPRYRAIADRLRAAGPLEDDALSYLVCAEETVAALEWQRDRLDEAYAAAAGVVADHFDRVPDDDAARAVVRAALIVATVDHDAERHDDARELLMRVLDRFGPLELEETARAEELLGYVELGRGIERFQRRGGGPAAEAAFRGALAHGSEAAWGYLGLVLLNAPGRRAEAVEALTRALDGEARELAGRAAYELGIQHELDGDLAAARLMYARAEVDGDGAVRLTAGRNLGFLAAAEGDREAAEAKLLTWMTFRVAERRPERTEDTPGVAGFVTAIAAGRLTRRAFRRLRHARWRWRRRRERLVRWPLRSR